MKKSVSIYPGDLPAGIIELIEALEPDDIAELARAGTQLSMFAGIGRAMFTVRDSLPATVIDYRPTAAAEPEPAPVQEIPAEPQREEIAADREEIGNRLPIERKPTGEAEENRRKIAALLADRGPMRAAELCAELGLSSSIMGYYLNGRPDWFQRIDPTNTKSKWNVTAAALAAIGVDPRPEVPPAPAPEPQPEPDRAEPLAADPDDPKAIAREQVLAIARAIFDAKGKLGREQIVAATGLDRAIVKNRLRNGGPNSTLPAFTYFSRTEQPDGVVLWGLTHNGAALVRESEANPQQPSGA